MEFGSEKMFGFSPFLTHVLVVLAILETWVDLGVGSLFQLSEFNPDTEESEEYI